MAKLNQSLMRASICSLIGIAIIYLGRHKEEIKKKEQEKLLKQVLKVDGERVDEMNNKRLVIFTGQVKDVQSIESPWDNRLGNVSDSLQAQLPLQIKTHVQICQWIEREHSHTTHKTKDNHTKTKKHTTYTYKKEWVSYYRSAVNYHEYKYQRDKIVDISNSQRQVGVEHIRVGDFQVEMQKVAAALPWHHLNPTQHLQNRIEHLKTLAPHVYMSDKYIYFSHRDGEHSSGDIRVSVEVKTVGGQMLTVLGQQQGQYIVDYPNTILGNINSVVLGTQPPHALLQMATYQYYIYIYYTFGALFNLFGLVLYIKSSSN